MFTQADLQVRLMELKNKKAGETFGLWHPVGFAIPGMTEALRAAADRGVKIYFEARLPWLDKADEAIETIEMGKYVAETFASLGGQRFYLKFVDAKGEFDGDATILSKGAGKFALGFKRANGDKYLVPDSNPLITIQDMTEQHTVIDFLAARMEAYMLTQATGEDACETATCIALLEGGVVCMDGKGGYTLRGPFKPVGKMLRQIKKFARESLGSPSLIVTL